jgi:CubicO group peptidase (beta-lactamase class C family)
MQTNVFTPAGVNNVGFEPLAGGKNALAYKFPHNNEKGWNSGNLASVAGGAGWRLSTKELLNVMNHARRKNTIISASQAQYMLDNSFGIDQMINTPAGKLYNKNGAWGNNSRTEQCVAYFWPQEMELVVFVNSPISDSNFSLRNIVSQAFINSLSN